MAPAAPTDRPDHHLWLNGRVWWVAFTFHFAGRRYRVRRSLGTREVAAARARRDALLDRYASQPGWRLSLRYPRSGGSNGEGGLERECERVTYRSASA